MCWIIKFSGLGCPIIMYFKLKSIGLLIGSYTNYCVSKTYVLILGMSPVYGMDQKLWTWNWTKELLCSNRKINLNTIYKSGLLSYVVCPPLSYFVLKYKGNLKINLRLSMCSNCIDNQREIYFRIMYDGDLSFKLT